MYGQEKIKPYGREGEKKQQVERMFDRIVPMYDELNHRLSWNIDRGWCKKVIKQLQPFAPQTILDIATGTGDFAILSAKMLQPKQLIGTDISVGMVEIGKRKVAAVHLDHIVSFRKEDCLALSFADHLFDTVTAAFSIRNFQDLDSGLREVYKVLKPGGHLSIVELTQPVSFPMKQLFKVYSHTLLPFYGKLLSKDKSAYKYLTSIIEAFPQGGQMVEMLQKTGFSNAKFKRLTLGICAIYFAEKE